MVATACGTLAELEPRGKQGSWVLIMSQREGSVPMASAAHPYNTSELAPA